jgi:uncharacterized membrane protein YuzA (DUF378 family)
MVTAWIYLIAAALTVIGALNWGLVGAFGFNAVTFLTRGNRMLTNVVYVIVGVAAVFVGTRRDTYLPFLGRTVMPCSVLVDRVPEHADKEVTVNGIDPGAKVLFWATEPATAGLATIKTWQQAYLEYANAGVATADSAGRAVLRVRSPQPYAVPVKGRLEAHVHWRACGDDGFLGPVQTTATA